VIIVSLIDVLIVVLIFMMVTTTFKQRPAVKVNLPESKVPREGVSENAATTLIVTIDKKEPYFYLGADKTAMTLDKLESELKDRVAQKPETVLAIRADMAASVGEFMKVWDAAKAARVKSVTVFTRGPGQP
jgi:biopolymer transport protein ExbD